MYNWTQLSIGHLFSGVLEEPGAKHITLALIIGFVVKISNGVQSMDSFRPKKFKYSPHNSV
jgi:hypothetical protein